MSKNSVLISPEESMLIDWLITMHSRDFTLHDTLISAPYIQEDFLEDHCGDE